MKRWIILIMVLFNLTSINSIAYASRYQACVINEFQRPERLERRLESGLYGQWNNTFTESIITVHDYNNNAQDYYSISKKPSHTDPNQLVLFLHGFPEFAWAWEEQLEYFGDEYHAVAIDLKGHHYSAKPEELAEYDYVKLAREIKEIVRCLGHETFILVGHDFGGALGYTFATLYPEMLNGLVILNAPHLYQYGREYNNPDGDQKERSIYVEYARGDSLADQINFFRIILADTSILRTPFYSGSRKLRIMIESWLNLANWKYMKNYYRSMYFPPDPDVFKSTPSKLQKATLTIHAPTLILWGLGDPFFSHKVLEGIEEMIPNLELHTFEEYTHWINHEMPDLNEYLEDFFVRHPAPPAN